MIRIRPFMDEDETRILSWCGDEETYYRWTAGVLGTPPITREQFRKTAALTRFTALEEETPAGFFTMRRPGNAPEELRIGFVIVDPARRGRGVGSTMLRLGVIHAFRVYRVERVSLGVFEDNLPARACYRAAGFVETGFREAYSIRGAEKFAVDMEVHRDMRGEAE